MTHRTRSFFDLVTKLARKHPHDHHFHLASIIVRRNTVISVGFNSRKTHPKTNTPFRNLHSEADCILGVDQRYLEGSSMFVARVGFNNRNKVLMSQPCEYCQAIIFGSGLRDCYFTIDESSIGYWDIRNNIWDTIKVA